MDKQRFIYKEMDEEGLETLQIISATGRFNKWMYESIRPFLKGDILEIGSGIGNITQYALHDQFKVTASDKRKSYCSMLHERFDKDPNLQEVRNIDIVHPYFDEEYNGLFDKFDCVFALNTIEHIDNDLLAMQNCVKLLRKNGHLIILVPAWMPLYNRFDETLKHFRRYSKSTLEKLFSKAGLQIAATRYFNFIGIFGWWFSGVVLRKRVIPEWQMKLFNILVPVFKLADKALMNKVGLSLITFGTKN